MADPIEDADAGSLGLILVLVYGTGLATTNVFLNRLGLADFSLIKPRAIFTGAIVLASLALLSAGPIHLFALVADRVNPIPRPVTAWFVTRSVGEIIAPIGIITWICWLVWSKPTGVPIGFYEHQFVVMPSPSVRFLNALAVASQLYFSSFATSALAVQSIRLFRAVTVANSFSGISVRVAKLTMFLAGVLLGLSWYIQVFATGLYGVIPQVVGGGAPETRQFIVQTASSAHISELGIRFSGEKRTLTMPLMVIYESDDFVGLIVKTSEVIPNPPKGVISESVESASVVRLDRKMFEGYVVPREDDDSSGFEDPDAPKQE